MTQVLDQQLIVHLFAPAEGPRAADAYRQLCEIWLGCRYLFRMTDPIPGIDLPDSLPDARDDLRQPDPARPELPLAAIERRGANYQAVLRYHHDTLNLSLALAPRLSTEDTSASDTWVDLDARWSGLTVGRLSDMLGEARLYLARIADPTPQPSAAVAGELRRLLPPEADVPGWTQRGVRVARGFAVWEPSMTNDARARRDIAIVAGIDADAAASAWIWSDGTVAIPPLARYLSHAAKVRYQLRVWRRDGRAADLRRAVDASVDELRRHSDTPARPDTVNDVATAHAAPDHAAADDAAAVALDRLRRLELDSALLASELRQMRHTVDIAASNMAAALGPDRAAEGPFADDQALAQWLITQLDDESVYLDATTSRAGRMVAFTRARPVPEARPARGASEPAGLAGPIAADRVARRTSDVSRNVFVIHGRDAAVRDGIFALLRALDLRPLEWEELVAGTGDAAPFLGEVLAHAVTRGRAAVVLLTPEDVVTLHPSLHEPTDDGAETGLAMQARPNVLLELGMALAAYPGRTVVVKVGVHRPIADLGGLNFIQLADSPDFRRKVAARLRLAGCAVDETGQDWLTAGDFAGLAAYRRTPEPERYAPSHSAVDPAAPDPPE